MIISKHEELSSSLSDPKSKLETEIVELEKSSEKADDFQRRWSSRSSDAWRWNNRPSDLLTIRQNRYQPKLWDCHVTEVSRSRLRTEQQMKWTEDRHGKVPHAKNPELVRNWKESFDDMNSKFFVSWRKNCRAQPPALKPGCRRPPFTGHQLDKPVPVHNRDIRRSPGQPSTYFQSS
jgi:hypothetical protein